MEQYKLGEMEQRFAEMIWAHAPVSSRVLTELCAEAFAWKRTTTYTMLKRLCDRDIFANRNGTVIALMSKQQFQAAKGAQFLKETFDGSLPQFLAAFSRCNRLSNHEIDALQLLIEEHKEG